MTPYPHTARGIETNGEGQPCTSHLNLTRSLADVGRPSRAAVKARWKAKRREIAAEYRNLVKRHAYAGCERKERAL